MYNISIVTDVDFIEINEFPEGTHTVSIKSVQIPDFSLKSLGKIPTIVREIPPKKIEQLEKEGKTIFTLRTTEFVIIEKTL